MNTYKFAKISSTNGEIFRTEKIDLLNNIIGEIEQNKHVQDLIVQK